MILFCEHFLIDGGKLFNLFNVSNTVKVCDVSKKIPNYVMQTLAMGPRNPVMEKFNEKEVLVGLDCFLKFCKTIMFLTLKLLT